MGALIHITRRSAQYLLIVVVALTLNFALPRMAPGDPLHYLMGEEAHRLTPEQRAHVLDDFGLDEPVLRQYGDYMAGIVTGDWGTSVRHRKPVREVVFDRLQYTVALVGGSIVLATVVGGALAVRAASRRGRRGDVSTVVSVMALDSMPVFWVGMILLGIFAVELGWFPFFGAAAIDTAPGVRSTLDFLQHLTLPLATLTIGTLGNIFLIGRYSVAGTLMEDYILMARASGVPRRRILFTHALRNALLPMVTAVMINVAFLFSGALVVETVFSYPGVGRLMFEGVLTRDYPLLQGTFVLLVFGVVLANLLADTAYPLLDPRVRRPADAS